MVICVVGARFARPPYLISNLRPLLITTPPEDYPLGIFIVSPAKSAKSENQRSDSCSDLQFELHQLFLNSGTRQNLYNPLVFLRVL